MNKFLQYINETLVSLDIPPLLIIEEKINSKRVKKTSKNSTLPQKK